MSTHILFRTRSPFRFARKKFGFNLTEIRSSRKSDSQETIYVQATAAGAAATAAAAAATAAAAAAGAAAGAAAAATAAAAAATVISAGDARRIGLYFQSH